MRYAWVTVAVVAALTTVGCGGSSENQSGLVQSTTGGTGADGGAAASNAAQAPNRQQPLLVSRYDNPWGYGSVPLSDADVDAILNRASNLLQTDDGPAFNGDGDVSCAVALVRAGAVSTFAMTAAPGTILNEQDYQKVCAQPGYVHVVNQIKWCSGYGENIIGCGDTPGTCFVVVREAFEGILWAHEYGHTKGLRHPCRIASCTPSEADRVMHPLINAGHVKIGSAECAAFMR